MSEYAYENQEETTIATAAADLPTVLDDTAPDPDFSVGYNLVEAPAVADEGDSGSDEEDEDEDDDEDDDEEED